MSQDEVESYWQVARRHAKISQMPGYFGPTTLEVVPPPAWSFGSTPEQADEILALVLDGTKTATASAAWDYEATGEALPAPGTMGILLDGAGHPRALVEVVEVEVVPFDEVSAEHALAEGEGDQSLEHWRAVHEQFFTETAEHDRGFSPSMPVVLETFAVLHQA